jgi:predicted CXXCH cytochrome family protein
MWMAFARLCWFGNSIRNNPFYFGGIKMKKLMLMLLVLGLVAPAAMADISNSHSQDFGCGACHDAHNKNDQAPPLWGRAASTESLTGYTQVSTARGIIGDDTTPAGASMLCMACHDGVSNTSGAGAVADKTVANGYVDTAVMHPISFSYTTFQGANSDFFNVASGNTVDKVVLYSGSMECGSCHDIHGTNTSDYALRGSDNTGEELCIDCHIK